jgi:hypothetical protein
MNPAGQPNKRLYQAAVCLSVQPQVSRDQPRKRPPLTWIVWPVT